MTDIEKKAWETYPNDNGFIPTLNQGFKREGYIKCAEEYESLPKIHGWIARNKDICGDKLSFFTQIPQRGTRSWVEPDTMDGLPYEDTPKELFPEVTWESEPVEVELLIRKI
jgi:hypothetical protein